MNGPDMLRAAVRAFNGCREDWNEKLSSWQLLTVYRVWLKTDCDVYPDDWTPNQLSDALQGWVPVWDDDGAEAKPTARIAVFAPIWSSVPPVSGGES